MALLGHWMANPKSASFSLWCVSSNNRFSAVWEGWGRKGSMKREGGREGGSRSGWRGVSGVGGRRGGSGSEGSEEGVK